MESAISLLHHRASCCHERVRVRRSFWDSLQLQLPISLSRYSLRGLRRQHPCCFMQPHLAASPATTTGMVPSKSSCESTAIFNQ